MNYYGMVYEKYKFFIEDPDLAETYALMIASQMLGELLAFQLAEEQGDQDADN